MPDNQSAVPVSQRAREAAASIWRWRGDYSTANDTAAGRADNSNFVKTFAAFERDILAGQSVGDYVLREDAAKEVDFLTRIAAASPFWPNGCADEIAKVAERIRTPASDSPTDVEALRAENARLHSLAKASNNLAVQSEQDRVRLMADNARLLEALKEAAAMLDWAARAMKGNCSGSDVNAVMLAAGRATEAHAALNDATDQEAE